MSALLVVRALLALVFLVAGVAKLVDLEGARAAVRGFGVPAPLAGAAGIALPVVELLAGALLVPADTAPYAALAAVALLLAFVAAIGRALALGQAPDCHCFGQLHSAPAGRGTLGRNAVLAAAAAFVAAAGFADGSEAFPAPRSAQAIIGLTGVVAIVAVLAALAWFGMELLRQNGRLLARVDALERAASPELTAPDAEVQRLDGGRTSIAALRPPGRALLLVFSDPGCGPCNALLPDVAAWQRNREDIDVVLVSQGSAAANRAHVQQHGLGTVVLDPERRVAKAYAVAGTPSAVLIDAAGRRRGEPASGAEQIRLLLPEPPALVVHQVGAREIDPIPPGVGDVAPAFELPGLDGPVRSEALRGAPMLVLFFNPTCGFCAGMLDGLHALEAEADHPTVVVVSSGDEHASRALGLRSPVALESGFATGRAFGAQGTPSAALVDADGRLAAPVAVGAPEVLALARGASTRVVQAVGA